MNKISFNLNTLEYCGKQLKLPEIAMAIQADNWESTKLLDGVNETNTRLDLRNRDGYREVLRFASASEYDAENLCNYIDECQRSGQLQLSAEFRHFEKAWRRDEMNHTIGFVLLESIVFGHAPECVMQELRDRPPNFLPMQDAGLLEDEFTISVAIAYDEITTTRGYADDIKTVYPAFENSAIMAWIRKVAADESRHFQNIVRVIKRNHSHRIGQIAQVVRKLLDWDTSSRDYSATFLMDHDGLAEEQVLESARILLRQFGQKYSL
jgi:hypothetical protein